MSKVFLRAFEEGDVKLVNEWRNNRRVQSLTCGHFRYVSSAMEKNWVENKMLNNVTDVYLAICLNDSSKKMIGYASINQINYLDRKAHWGGIVIDSTFQSDFDCLIDSIKLILQHAFDDLNLHRLTGSCISEHKASQSMMEMMGFSCEGIERDSLYKNGTYHNIHLYSLLDEEYYSYVRENGYTRDSIFQRLLTIKKNKITKK